MLIRYESGKSWFAVFFWNKLLLLLYFYKTADQFVCSCLKQKQFNKKKHQQISLLNFCFLFSPNTKKKLSFVWLEAKKKEYRKPKTTLLGKGWGKEGKTSKAFLFGHVGKKKKFFFSYVFYSFVFSEISFLKQKQDYQKKKNL